MALAAALGALERAGNAVAAHGGLTPAEGFEVAAAATVFAGMIWPMAHPSAVLRELYQAEPDLARACPPFAPTLERLIHALAEGLRAVRPPDNPSGET